MADEVKIAFGLAGKPDECLRAWKASPPEFLANYKLEDESYDTLVYRAHVMGIGMKILMFGMADTIYALDVTFTARDAGSASGESVATRVTISGQAKEPVRDQIGAYLRQHTEPLA